MLNVAEMKRHVFRVEILLYRRNRMYKKKQEADECRDEMLFSVSRSAVSATKTARCQICAGIMAEYIFYFL